MNKQIDVDENRMAFIMMTKNYIQRDGIESLLEYLKKSDFFTAPASTAYHLDCPGGLCLHSMNVFNRLIREVEGEWESVEKSPYSLETLALVGLFHDLCKVDFYKETTRNVKDEHGKWTKVPYYIVDEKLPICHSFKSQYILRSYVNLSREESVAIMSHMGGFDATVKGGDFSIGNAFKKFPLAVMLHIADLKATYLDERDM